MCQGVGARARRRVNADALVAEGLEESRAPARPRAQSHAQSHARARARAHTHTHIAMREVLKGDVKVPVSSIDETLCVCVCVYAGVRAFACVR